MTDEELLSLSNQILERLERGDKDSGIALVQMQMLRLISHVRSEQRVATNMANEMKLLSDAIFGSKSHPKDMPGMINCLREVKEAIATNRKIHAFIGTGVGALIIKSAYDLLTHVKP